MISGVGGIGLRRVAASVAAVAVGAGIFMLRHTGFLRGWPALLFAVLLSLALPFSSRFSRRVLLSGALFLGWIPTLWWVRLPVPEVDRMGIVLALLSGALVLWVLWGADVRERARRLMPRFAPVDAMPFAAAGLATWVTWPFLVSSDGVGSLTALIRMGWDNTSHFAMALLVRAEGAIVPLLPRASNGSVWVWHDYPQHYHATVTAVTELYARPGLGDTAMEVMRYGRSMALVFILAAALLAAGVAQLPRLRLRPAFAWPLGALLVAAFVLGPGAWALTSAFPNFVLAAATAGLAVLLAASLRDGPIRPLHVFVLGGLFVATLHGWAPLAPMAAGACALILVPWRRDRWPGSRWGWVLMTSTILVTLVASLAVVPILMGSGGVGALSTDNDILSSGLTKLSYLLKTAGVALAVALAAYVRKNGLDSTRRDLMLAGLSVLAFLLVGLLGGYLYLTGGSISYYFDKLLVGVSLISVATLAACVELHVAAPPPTRGRLRKSMVVAVSLLASAAALQAFGATGVHARELASELTSTPSPAAERLLKAAELTESRPLGSTVYIGALPGDLRSDLGRQWVMALSRTWAYGQALPLHIPKHTVDVVEASAWTEKLLQATQEKAVIVAPEIAEAVRSHVSPEYRDRVITWDTF